MRMRLFATTLTLAAMFAVTALAQPTAPQTPRTPQTRQAPKTPTTPAAPPAAPSEPAPPQPPPAPPRRVGQPVNVRVDVTITDQGRAGAQTVKKTVSIVTGDGLSGRIRSMADYMNIGLVPLNVDADTELLADNKIRVRVSLQYDLPVAGDATGAELTKISGPLRKTQIQENLALVLENGKSIVAAQSADPVGDRQVTIELKATILR
jgi:hypothetical protein